MSLDNLISLIDNSSNLFMSGMAFIQTGILVVSFFIGSQYLEQHKQKVLAEKKNHLIDRCIRISNELTRVYSQLFNIPFDEFKQLTDQRSPKLAEKLMEDFFIRHKDNLPIIQTLKSELAINVSLIKDENIKNSHRQYKEAIDMLFGSYIAFQLENISYEEFIETVPSRLDSSGYFYTKEYMRTRNNLLKILYESYHDF